MEWPDILWPRGASAHSGAIIVPVLTRYLETAMATARLEKLDDGSWYAEIPACPGVWATGADQGSCLAELREVLEEWVLLKLHDGDSVPRVDGVELKVERV
jgi:predicted RNase H-like HicB family nuclease